MKATTRDETTADAVEHGIKVSAGVVTSAAIVMVFVFAIFADAVRSCFLKQFGVGLAAAILIDATIIRAVLLPATLKLLDDSIWYLPTLARVASPDRARESDPRRRRCWRPSSSAKAGHRTAARPRSSRA